MKIHLSDWLTNAGILGFLRLQKLRGFEYDLSKGYIEVEAKQLDGFEEAYFSYALMKGFDFFFRFESFNKLQKLLSREEYTSLQEEVRELINKASQNIEPDWENFEQTIASVVSEVDNLIKSVKTAVQRKSPNDPKTKNGLIK